MSHSIHDVSAATGVSEQAIRRWCERNGVTRNVAENERSGKKRNEWALSDSDYAAALAYYASKEDGRRFRDSPQAETQHSKVSSDSEATKLLVDQVRALSGQLDVANAQLEAKDAQLAAKDSQIASLMDSLAVSQHLLEDAQGAIRALSQSTAVQIAADKRDVLSVPQDGRDRQHRNVFKRIADAIRDR